MSIQEMFLVLLRRQSPFEAGAAPAPNFDRVTDDAAVKGLISNALAAALVNTNKEVVKPALQSALRPVVEVIGQVGPKSFGKVANAVIAVADNFVRSDALSIIKAASMTKGSFVGSVEVIKEIASSGILGAVVGGIDDVALASIKSLPTTAATSTLTLGAVATNTAFAGGASVIVDVSLMMFDGVRVVTGHLPSDVASDRLPNRLANMTINLSGNALGAAIGTCILPFWGSFIGGFIGSVVAGVNNYEVE
jgi:hypothetical protein